ncbi:hypothetical protein EV175_000729 [Coemansia sp. RSA 1933]|nr:hypothetical protein EV175_000729 [Coemansia sp. RSA 1933]
MAVAALPFSSAYTYTSEITGVETVTASSTDGNGDVELETSTSSYTSYLIYMNDLKLESTFVGIPFSTTDADGDPSTYMSLEPYVPSVVTSIPIGTISVSPTATDSSDSSGTHAESSASGTESSSAGSGDKSSKTSIGPIVGGVVGGVVVLILLAVGGWFYKRKRDRKRHLEEHQKEEMQLLAMELDGSYNPKGGDKNGGVMSDINLYANPDANVSFTDDLASKYTGGSLSRNLPSLREAYSAGAQHINIGTEITMDSQGRMGMPDGSPLIIDSILPLRNVKAADNYTDLEWFPLVTNEKELMQHSGPSYIEEKELSYVAKYIQRPGVQKGISPVVKMQKRP